MSKYAGYIVIIIVLLALIGENTESWHRLFIQGLLLISAIHLMFKRKLPKTFWGDLFGLIFLPALFCCLVVAMLHQIPGFSEMGLNSLGVLGGLLVILYVWIGWFRWRKNRNQPQKKKSNERTFILPGHSHSKTHAGDEN
ncbi:MAG: hypothetical protein DWQ10_02735 [Calditrichaeota bacterium]|nr:MAG: hypothetical protein DWQ10_02735 [Calditrichota bacterium]